MWMPPLMQPFPVSRTKYRRLPRSSCFGISKFF
jgi:hypothetical protein